jgi:hypothetical protein
MQSPFYYVIGRYPDNSYPSVAVMGVTVFG